LRPLSLRAVYVLDGADVGQLPRDELALIRNSKIGFVFQQFNLFPALTALENVEYALNVKGTRSPEARREATRALEAVDLRDRLHFLPRDLSGGQKQRVAIARALAGGPQVILADEPTANLDHKTAYLIIDLMRTMRDGFGTTFLFSTHDPKIVGSAEVIFTLEDGELTGKEVKGGCPS
jgi:putative ABC transport system ATP-binding protein